MPAQMALPEGPVTSDVIATIRRWGGMFNRLGRLRFRACNGAKELARAQTRSGACSHAMPKPSRDIIRILLHGVELSEAASWAASVICLAPLRSGRPLGALRRPLLTVALWRARIRGRRIESALDVGLGTNATSRDVCFTAALGA